MGFGFVIPLLLLAHEANSLNVLAVGATGAVGRSFVRAASQEGNVLVLARNGYLATAKERVSGDFGYLGPKIHKLKGVLVRDWDGGDLLDITGDTWLGWQGDVAAFQADAAVMLTGCLTDARLKGVERIADAFTGMAPADVPKRLLFVCPADEVIKNPTARENVAAAERRALALGESGVCDVASVRVGRVLALEADEIESKTYNLQYRPPVTLLKSLDPHVPWIHSEDVTAALRALASRPDPLNGACLVLDGSAPPPPELAQAGFSYAYTGLEQIAGARGEF